MECGGVDFFVLRVVVFGTGYGGVGEIWELHGYVGPCELFGWVGWIFRVFREFSFGGLKNESD